MPQHSMVPVAGTGWRLTFTTPERRGVSCRRSCLRDKPLRNSVSRSRPLLNKIGGGV